jgi:hypothetical protein
MVDDGQLFGETHRVMQGRLQHGKADRRLPDRRRQRGGEGDRVDIGADAVEMSK